MKSLRTEADWQSLSPETRQVVRGILVLTLPNPEGLSEDALFAAGKELLMAGAISLVADGDHIGIEVADVQ